MPNAILTCTKCSVPVPAELYNLPRLTPCPACAAPLLINVFPAFVRTTTSVMAESLLIQGESSCFYHTEKKAVLPCDSCGRFLCALCDVDFNGQHVCPTCLEVGKKKGKIKNLLNHRTRYDSIAIALAVFPLLIFYITPLTAPIAIYIAIRYWNAPVSIVPRRHKVRYVSAIVIASLQIIGWAVGIYYFTNR